MRVAVGGGHHVLLHGHVQEQAQRLERAGDAALADLVWLQADDAKPGEKLASWVNPHVAGVTATAAAPEQQPMVVANALNGHAVVRFDNEVRVVKLDGGLARRGAKSRCILGGRKVEPWWRLGENLPAANARHDDDEE